MEIKENSITGIAVFIIITPKIFINKIVLQHIVTFIKNNSTKYLIKFNMNLKYTLFTLNKLQKSKKTNKIDEMYCLSS